MKGHNVSKPTAVESNDMKTAKALIERLQTLHPELHWSLYPLADHDQYAELGAPDTLVSFSSVEQELEAGLVDPYSTVLGQECAPEHYGLSAEAGRLIRNFNQVFVSKYPNCDGPRYQKKTSG